MNKNSTQISIPFDIPEGDIKPYVKQHWNITFSRQGKVSVYSKKIMALVMAQIKDDENGFSPYYQIHVSDIVADNQTQNVVYSKVKNAFDELTDLKWLIEDLDNGRFAYRHLLNTSHAECGYNKGVITVALNPLLKDYFIALSHYTIYELKWYMTFTSWYSMRLYELLSAFKDSGYWIVSVNEYRKLMDCEKKYNNSSLLLQKTTSEALTELASTDLAFSVDSVRDNDPKIRGRKPIIAYKFKLEKVKAKKIPKEWFQFSDEHRKVLEKLMKRYLVTESNILRYAKDITLKGCKDLLKQWDEKEASNRNRIDNKLKYCNAVFVRVGKESQKDKAN